MPEPNMYHGILHDVLAFKRKRRSFSLSHSENVLSMHLLNTITDFGYTLPHISHSNEEPILL